MKYEVYKLTDGNMALIGELCLQGGRILAPASLERILDTPLEDGFDVVDSATEPERFLKLLPKYYRNEPITVAEVVDA